jgi:hypothetical protein
VAIEAISLGRKVIAIDLGPLATFITRTSLIPVDLKDLDLAFEEVQKAAKQRIYELYITKCKKGHTAIMRCSVLAFVVECPNCKNDICMDKASRPKGQKQNMYTCPARARAPPKEGVKHVTLLDLLSKLEYSTVPEHGYLIVFMWIPDGGVSHSRFYAQERTDLFLGRTDFFDGNPSRYWAFTPYFGGMRRALYFG